MPAHMKPSPQKGRVTKAAVIIGVAVVVAIVVAIIINGPAGEVNSSSSANDSSESTEGVSELDAGSSSGDASDSSSSGGSDSSASTEEFVEKTITATNGSGYSITSLNVRETSSEDYADSTAVSVQGFDDGTTQEITFSVPTSVASGTVDLLCETSDGFSFVVHDIDLFSIGTIDIKFDNGVGYVSYEDPETGEVTDNRDESADAEANSDTTTYDQQTQYG